MYEQTDRLCCHADGGNFIDTFVECIVPFLRCQNQSSDLRNTRAVISPSLTAATCSWSQATKGDGLHHELFFLWHAEEQKKWNNDNGAHYFFTSEQEQNQMFHICSCLLGISMRMCRQCFNAAQLTARERGWRPQHWAVLPVPDVPPCCRDNTMGCPAFNKSHPVSFLCPPDTGEMLNPLKPTVMTPSIPSQRSNGFTLLLIIDKYW